MLPNRMMGPQTELWFPEIWFQGILGMLFILMEQMIILMLVQEFLPEEHSRKSAGFNLEVNLMVVIMGF